MLKPTLILWSLAPALVLGAASGALAESKFFLFVSNDVPTQALVDSAIREARSSGPPAEAEVSRAKLTRAFPQLFDPPSGERTTIDAELEAGTAAHYATNFEQAEVHLARAFEVAYARPELLDANAVVVQRLADGAALRYGNATVTSRDAPEARRHLREFIRRFPRAEPTRTEHPPPVLEVWAEILREVTTETGSLMAYVQPLELERAGNCRLLMNGAEIGRLPLSGPVSVPAGEQLIQARCGLQRSWIQRVEVRNEPVTLRVPVRAMMAARAETRSGGIVLTRPEVGDAAALVAAVSEAADFDGAVIVEAVIGKALIGRWERGSVGPSIDKQGKLEGDAITGVTSYRVREEPSGGGPVWAWVVGGVGLAALAGGVVANVMYNDEFNSGQDRDKLDTLRGAALGLYIGGGVLLATGIVLYFVESASGGGGHDAAAFEPGGGSHAPRSWSVSPGGLTLSF